MAYPKNILFTFYMVEHYLDIKRKHNFNSKDTMLQIVTTPRHNCQKFVSKRFDSKLSREKNSKSEVFFRKKSDSKLTFEFDHFCSLFFSQYFIWFASGFFVRSSGSLLMFFLFSLYQNVISEIFFGSSGSILGRVF